ncbi:hypothetical protein MBLNU459_g4480t1 [Dothideomycetes sp. NU459]
MASIETTTYSTTTLSSTIFVTTTVTVPIPGLSTDSSSSLFLTFGTAPSQHTPYISSSPAAQSLTTQSSGAQSLATQSSATQSATRHSSASSSDPAQPSETVAPGHGSEFIGKDGGASHSAAIAGGITGAFAGVALIGLLALLLLRRRRKQEHPQQQMTDHGKNNDEMIERPPARLGYRHSPFQHRL